MADVFISYANRDRVIVAPIVDQLASHGFSIAWDVNMPLGVDWQEHLSKAIKEARQVIVFWSEAAVASKFVTTEASYAAIEKKLVPIALDGFDLSSLPPQLAYLHTVRLPSDPSSPEWQLLVHELRRRLQPHEPTWGTVLIDKPAALDSREQSVPAKATDDRFDMTLPKGVTDPAEEPSRARVQPPLDSFGPLSELPGNHEQVFISYSRSDQEICDRLAQCVSAHGVTAFVDRSMSGGSRWKGLLVRKIEACTMMVVLVSRNSDSSANVAREVGLAIEKCKPILPIYIEKVTLAGDLGYDLSGLNHRDISQDVPRLLQGVADEVKTIVSEVVKARGDRPPPTTFEGVPRKSGGVPGGRLIGFALVCLFPIICAVGLSIAGRGVLMRETSLGLSEAEAISLLFLVFLPYCLWVLRLFKDLAPAQTAT